MKVWSFLNSERTKVRLGEEDLKKRFIVMLLFCLFVSGMSTTVYAVSDIEVSTTKQPDDKVLVSWNSIEGAVEYQIWMSVGENAYKKKTTIQVEESTSETVSEVEENTQTASETVSETEENTQTTSETVSETEESVQTGGTKEVTEVSVQQVISGISKKKTYYIRVKAFDKDGSVIAQDTTSFYNGNIVSTTKQKYSYTDMQKDIKQLQQKYSDYVHVEVIGTTADKRSIYDVILGNPDAKKCIVVQASIHAREYMTSQLVMKQMEYYLDNYNQKYKKKTYKDIFDKVCVHVVAMSNPDGVTISQKGFSGIKSASLRKKLKKMHGARYTTIWKANARGVDLNNQFNNNFKYIKKYKKGAYAGYGGKKPVSEAESKALVKLVNDVKPKAVVNYHAMGNVIYCNYGASKKMQKKVYKLAGEIRGLTGYYYMGLDTAPGFANWLVCKKGIPSCTVEIGKNTAPVPISQFETVWKQNKDVMVASARLYY